MPCEHRTFVYFSLSCHSMMQTPCKIVQDDEEEEKNTIKIGPYGCVNAIKFERLFSLVSIFHFLFLFISYVFCTCLDDKLNIHWSLFAFANFQTGNKICLKCSFLILVFFSIHSDHLVKPHIAPQSGCSVRFKLNVLVIHLSIEKENDTQKNAQFAYIPECYF